MSEDNSNQGGEHKTTLKETLIWTAGVVSILVIGIVAYILLVSRPPANEPIKQVSGTEGGTPEVIDIELKDPSDIDTTELWTLINDYRLENGVGVLNLNPKLNASAQAKCEDMVNRDYWGHNDPEGEDFSIFFDSQSYSPYTWAGENLAYGFSSASATFSGWQKSPGHNSNLLDPDYTEVGYSVCFSEDFVGNENQLVVVQHLGRP